jgi:hypothetical protein
MAGRWIKRLLGIKGFDKSDFCEVFTIIQGFGLMIPNLNQYPSWNGLDL